MQEGNLQAPTRHPLDWQNPSFYDEELLHNEMERVFDLCHGCRRCVSLCQSFPVLFDLMDDSKTMEVDGVDKKDYQKVVDECFLCDLCYMTKCPYTPPHEWNIDFPHLMLRAKAVQFKQKGASITNQLLASPQLVGKMVSSLKLAKIVNKMNDFNWVRKLLKLHPQALIPKYHNKTATKLLSKLSSEHKTVQSDYKVAIFITCYGQHNDPQIVTDLVAVLQHNEVAVQLLQRTQCCGMPKLELGDIQSAMNYAQQNKTILLDAVNQGYKIMAPIPSCVLMFKNELPMMLPADKDIQKIANAFVDPFEYLDFLNDKGVLNTDFENQETEVLYHMACHQRVQNIGTKTKKILSLIPDITLNLATRCSGHDGTYGVKKHSYEFAVKIGKPVAKKVTEKTDYIVSDCVMAGNHIAHINEDKVPSIHPITLLKQKYRL
ncbi:Fe-S oxidoreductase-like protein in Rubrerythrincluster [Bathymodiolus heckerae thiotrophic gill symbiont]|uniref:(Fe-S)-binding protein n=1 Tax=Bathymodiolus heckerae thiotrophic gill symbiont TaxID=1052212 RepID=UPI0010B9E59A|nr:heterodisulfide reductase-related iron-sulfur binding cluster [Bathymodiolus heckerae thiotrophic gill symbiont]SHN89588.1 Fe-S oxidoreductase-like protein in Rubrerythrincluster [Bathymodiolus heckerae thiotrophic gill symbiont]